jgi:two-component system phosphate regulon sensor histidine kinase PhoR
VTATGAGARSDPAFAPLEHALVEALLEQLPVAVILVEAPDGRIVLANRAARDQLPEAALRATSTAEYMGAARIDGSAIEPEELPLARALAGEIVGPERVRYRTDGGDWRTVEVRASPVREGQGAIIAAVSTFLDVSDHERREQADREFVANAAHQLRNPLAAIRSAVEVLQAGAKEDPETRDRFLGHVERESTRLTELARALLLLARAQAMVEAPRREIVQLAPLLHDLAVRLDGLPGVSIAVRCSPDLAAVSNPELLGEALWCLAENAVRYAPGGHVELSARAVDESVAVEVRDQGPGIPPEVRQRAFERFYRASEGAGFGLGLAIAFQAAQAIGATLEIESEPGEGTTARMLLPVARLLTR